MSPLERQLLDLQARLEADPYFADIPVFILRPRAQEGAAQIQTRIDQALTGLVKKAGKAGAAVTLLMPTGDTDKPNVPGPQLRFTYTARVQEIIAINFGPQGTQKSAEEIALAVLQLCHLCQFNGANVLYADPATLTPSLDADPKLTYDVRFLAQGGLPKPLKVALPIITVVGDTATVACATAGAAIYTTTDDSYPSPLNPAASLYAAPLVPGPCTVRACAFLAGYQQSDVHQAAVAA